MTQCCERNRAAWRGWDQAWWVEILLTHFRELTKWTVKTCKNHLSEPTPRLPSHPWVVPRSHHARTGSAQPVTGPFAFRTGPSPTEFACIKRPGSSHVPSSQGSRHAIIVPPAPAPFSPLPLFKAIIEEEQKTVRMEERWMNNYRLLPRLALAVLAASRFPTESWFLSIGVYICVGIRIYIIICIYIRMFVCLHR